MKPLACWTKQGLLYSRMIFIDYLIIKNWLDLILVEFSVNSLMNFGKLVNLVNPDGILGS